MAYNNSYEATDIAPATISSLSAGFITAVAFIPLIALVILYVWFRKNVFKG